MKHLVENTAVHWSANRSTIACAVPSPCYFPIYTDTNAGLLERRLMFEHLSWATLKGSKQSLSGNWITPTFYSDSLTNVG